jgi:hypothetical protein
VVRLGRTFGFVAGEEPANEQPKLFDPMSRTFSFDLGDRPATTAGALGNLGAFRTDGALGDSQRPVLRSKTRGRSLEISTRYAVPTLKIQTLHEDKLKAALMESMRRVEETTHDGSSSRVGSPANNGNGTRHSLSASSPKSIEDDEAFPAPILHLRRADGGLEKPRPASASPPAPGKHQRQEPGKYVGKSVLAKSAEEDTQLPIFPFAAGAEFQEPQEKKTLPAKTAAATTPKRSKLHSNAVNDAAKFLPLPAGKFRREFSADHPLVAGGTGKYSKELRQGLRPAGVPQPAKQKKVTSSLEDDVLTAVQLAGKVERLTYQAETSVIEEAQDIDKLRKEMNVKMSQLLEEERTAEDERLHALANVHDPSEKANIDAIFAEERRRASDKIIAATREYDKTIKHAMLKTMNLGQG